MGLSYLFPAARFRKSRSIHSQSTLAKEWTTAIQCGIETLEQRTLLSGTPLY
jgi:hypothetical protein